MITIPIGYSGIGIILIIFSFDLFYFFNSDEIYVRMRKESTIFAKKNSLDE